MAQVNIHHGPEARGLNLLAVIVGLLALAALMLFLFRGLRGPDREGYIDRRTAPERLEGEAPRLDLDAPRFNVDRPALPAPPR